MGCDAYIMKREAKRGTFKNNFLKNIVVRFDYTGMSENELDSIVAKIKPIFKKAHYNRMKEEHLTEMDFQLQDPESIEVDGLPIKEIRKKIAYVFTNEEKGIKCKISTQFIFISIQNRKYVEFSEYSSTIMQVVSVLKEDVEFLNFERFGIRKINQCIIKDIRKIHDYFEEKYYMICGLEDNRTPKLFESKDCYIDGKYNINYTRMVINGEYDGETAYQVVLDSDVYSNNSEHIEKIISDDEELNNMNEILFDLFKEVLTENFIVKLSKEEYTDTNIIGVDKNE